MALWTDKEENTMAYYPEGWLINTFQNRAATANVSALSDAMREGRILEGRALVCDSAHNLLVDLNGIRGIIPREEGAIGIREGTVRDIALISRVNRPVCFVITDIEKSGGQICATLSRRKAQERCLHDFIESLIPGDVVDARITHLEPFGAFADIGCGLISLLPIDGISISRIEHPRERFFPDMDIRAIIKSKENRKITLSHKELLGTWEENAALFSAGATVAGIVRSVEPYGIFIELTPNLAGLAEARPGVFPGQQASVYIKNILPARMKIKLVIIDTFSYHYKPIPPKYYFEGRHMDAFRYSPDGCPKQISTVF